MEILLKQGDRLPIPDGCKAVIEGNLVLIEQKELEFKDGEVVVVVAENGRNCPFIFKGKDEEGFNMFYAGLNCEAQLILSDSVGSRFGNGKPVFATDEEKQLLFDKMKEQGLRWNAEEKRVEKIRWTPKDGDKCWLIWPSMRAVDVTFDSLMECHRARVKVGNYFRTQEQTEKAAEVVKEALRKFHEENG